MAGIFLRLCVLLTDISVDQQPNFLWQVQTVQFDGIFVRFLDNLPVFPVNVCDAIHDAIYAETMSWYNVYSVSSQYLLPWWRILPLNREVIK